MVDYLDFTIRIGAAGAGFRAVVIDSPAGEGAQCELELPFSPAELARWAHAFGRSVRAAGPGAPRHLAPEEPDSEGLPDVDEVGRRLAEALLGGPVRDRLLQSLVKARALPGQGLRIKLRLDLSEDGAARLHRLPWELLASPDSGRPLALSRHTPLVRYLEVASGFDLPPAPSTLDVRLLAARPSGVEPLDLEAEVRSLQSALGEPSAVSLRSSSSPTLAGVVETLRRGGVHVLHFMGHGDVDARTGEGILALEDAAGRVDAVTGHRLVEMAGDYLPSVRLVFLNACRTAEAAERAPFAGVATALVNAGVPAVIAMQYPVSDAAAALFASTVYGRIAAGAPVDEAVTEGRLALQDARGRTLPDLPEWMTPALFLRVADGKLFVPAGAPGPVRVKAGQPVPRRGLRLAAALAAALLMLLGALALSRLDGRAPDRRAPVETTGEAYEPDSGRSLEAAGPAPSEPGAAGGSPASRPASPDRELSDGDSAYFEEVSARVTVDFLVVEGTELVRLSVRPDRGTIQRRAAFGPTTVAFQWGEDALSLDVHHVDWGGRTVRLSASRGPRP